MTETVNTLAAAVRQGGGVVAWVLSRMTAMPRHFAAILGADLATRYFNDGQAGGAGTRLWHALDRKPDDVVAIKAGASAFFPGKCNLKPQLDARGVDTILIAGAVTNICCESSARDAMMLNFKTIMLSDANAARTDEEHNATLSTFYALFGDVMDTDFAIRRLEAGAALRVAAE